MLDKKAIEDSNTVPQQEGTEPETTTTSLESSVDVTEQSDAPNNANIAQPNTEAGVELAQNTQSGAETPVNTSDAETQSIKETTQQVTPAAPDNDVVTENTPLKPTDSTESPEENTPDNIVDTTEQATDDTPSVDQEQALNAKNGWIYAGQYSNGTWIKTGLELPTTALPEAGKTYTLTWGSNVRAAPPGKRRTTTNSSNLAKSIDYLGVGKEIQITTVKNSGRTGHIWLEIKY